MDALPGDIRGHVNFECAHSWVGTDDLFALVQGRDGMWTAYVPSPDLGPVRKSDPILASNIALDTAIELWESIHGKKVPNDFGFSRFHYTETVG